MSSVLLSFLRMTRLKGETLESFYQRILQRHFGVTSDVVLALITVIFKIITFLIQKHLKTVTATVILGKLIRIISRW